MNQSKTYLNLLLIPLFILISINYSFSKAINAFKNPYILVQNYSIEDYNASCQNWDILVSKEGFVFVANNSGLVEFDGNTWHLYQTKDKEAILQIGMRNDTLFSKGTHSQGFWKYNKEMKMEYYPTEDPIPDSVFVNKDIIAPFPVSDIIKDAKPKIFAGSSSYKFISTSKGLFITDTIGHILHHVNMNNSLQDNTIHDIFIQHSDQLWLALDNGITMIRINPAVCQLGKRSFLGKLEQVGHNENHLFIKTNIGYFRKSIGSQNTFEHIEQDTAKNYLGDTPEVIEKDIPNLFFDPTALGDFKYADYCFPQPNNYFWLVKNNQAGLFHNEFKSTTQKCRILFDNYHMNLTTRNPYFFYINDSMYVVSAMQGVLLVDTRQIMRQCHQTVTNTEIHTINYTDESGKHNLSPKSGNITLPHNFQNIKIFVSTSVISQNHQFSYLLEGLTTEWSEWQKDGKISFSQLPPGNYTLRIRKFASKGPFPEITLNIKVETAWYNSIWAYCTYVLIIWFIIQTFLQYNLRRLKKEEQEEKERKLKEEQHKLELIKNQVLEAELQGKNNELTLQTSALVRRNQAIQILLDELVAQKETLGDRYPNKLYNKLHSMMENALNDKEDWLLFESYFNSAHQNFRERLLQKYPELTPGDLRICCLLRMNLSTKEIASLLNISVRAVELRRYRLRKRLELDGDVNLLDFLLKL